VTVSAVTAASVHATAQLLFSNASASAAAAVTLRNTSLAQLSSALNVLVETLSEPQVGDQQLFVPSPLLAAPSPPSPSLNPTVELTPSPTRPSTLSPAQPPTPPASTDALTFPYSSSTGGTWNTRGWALVLAVLGLIGLLLGACVFCRRKCAPQPPSHHATASEKLERRSPPRVCMVESSTPVGDVLPLDDSNARVRAMITSDSMLGDVLPVDDGNARVRAMIKSDSKLLEDVKAVTRTRKEVMSFSVKVESVDDEGGDTAGSAAEQEQAREPVTLYRL